MQSCCSGQRKIKNTDGLRSKFENYKHKQIEDYSKRCLGFNCEPKWKQTNAANQRREHKRKSKKNEKSNCEVETVGIAGLAKAPVLVSCGVRQYNVCCPNPCPKPPQVKRLDNEFEKLRRWRENQTPNTKTPWQPDTNNITNNNKLQIAQIKMFETRKKKNLKMPIVRNTALFFSSCSFGLRTKI